MGLRRIALAKAPGADREGKAPTMEQQLEHQQQQQKHQQ